MWGYLRYVDWLEAILGRLGVALPSGRGDERVLGWKCFCGQVNGLTAHAFGLAS